MFERFTDRARRVVVLAQEEARQLNHGYIGTEHLLLGLLYEGEGVAAKALESLGISVEAVRSQVEEVVGPGDAAPSGHIPFTPRSKKVLELSLREALALKHNYIGTEHILLGLLREGEGLAAQVLVTLGADLSGVREQVLRQLSGFARPATRSARALRTPAATSAADAARTLAAGGRVGTHHLLLALLADEDSLAARVLASFGVTTEAAEDRVDELGIEGTSDESPEEAGARRMQLRVTGDRLEVLVEDPALVRGLQEVVVSGTDPAGARFPELWKALKSTTGDLARRLAAEPEWVAEGWDDQTVAGYVVRCQPDGLSGRLTLSSTGTGADVRPLLSSWAKEQAGSHPKASRPCASFSVVVERGPAGEGLRVRPLVVGRKGDGKGAPAATLPRRPLRELLAFAAGDLGQAA